MHNGARVTRYVVLSEPVLRVHSSAILQHTRTVKFAASKPPFLFTSLESKAISSSTEVTLAIAFVTRVPKTIAEYKNEKTAPYYIFNNFGGRSEKNRDVLLIFVLQ